MPISKHFDRSKQHVTFICSGELSYYEVSSHLEAIYASDDIEQIRDVMWNLRDATLAGFSNEEIRMLSDIVRGHNDLQQPGKSAWVLPNDEDFGLGRMYEALTNDLPSKNRVFRTMEEALQWLGEVE
jgi:hypothetical protein